MNINPQYIRLIQRIKTYCIHNQLIQPAARIIIGCSGGGDSVALVAILNQLKVELNIGKLFVAHINHGIRSDAETSLEYDLVQQLCQKFNLVLHTTRIDVPSIALENKLNLEAAARKARHEYFQQLAKELNCDTIALGHNLNDRVETALFNVIRGAGPIGSASMQPHRDNIIRPLLDCTRSELRSFLKSEEIMWIEDSSNQDLTLSRNSIREKILPHLKDINPQALNNIANFLDLQVMQNELVNEYITTELTKRTNEYSLNLEGELTLAQIYWLVYSFLTMYAVPKITKPKIDEAVALYLSHKHNSHINISEEFSLAITRDGMQLIKKH